MQDMEWRHTAAAVVSLIVRRRPPLVERQQRARFCPPTRLLFPAHHAGWSTSETPHTTPLSPLGLPPLPAAASAAASFFDVRHQLAWNQLVSGWLSSQHVMLCGAQNALRDPSQSVAAPSRTTIRSRPPWSIKSSLDGRDLLRQLAELAGRQAGQRRTPNASNGSNYYFIACRAVSYGSRKIKRIAKDKVYRLRITR